MFKIHKIYNSRAMAFCPRPHKDEEGKIKPVLDRCYALNEVTEAFRYFGEGHAIGKVVITVAHSNKS